MKTSRIEAEALTGFRAKTQADRRKVAAWLHEQGVARLFMTLGADGVFYSTGDEQGIEKPRNRKRTIRNAGGAGDAFLSGIAYAWINEWSLSKSVHFALAAADVTVSDRASSSSALSLANVNRVYRSSYAR